MDRGDWGCYSTREIIPQEPHLAAQHSTQPATRSKRVRGTLGLAEGSCGSEVGEALEVPIHFCEALGDNQNIAKGQNKLGD